MIIKNFTTISMLQQGELKLTTITICLSDHGIYTPNNVPGSKAKVSFLNGGKTSVSFSGKDDQKKNTNYFSQQQSFLDITSFLAK